MSSFLERVDWARWRPRILFVLGLLLAIGILDSLRALLREVSYQDVAMTVRATPAANLVLAALATALSYLLLSGYDFSGLRYAQVRIKRSTVVLTSFIAYALGNTVGIGVLTGAAVRMRMYAAAGVDTARVAQAVAFNALAFGLGVSVFGALGLLWGALQVAAAVRIPAPLLQLIALAALAGAVAFLILCARRRHLTFGPSWSLRLPEPGLAIRQLVVSALDLAASAAALWFLLPAHAVALPVFIAGYAMAITLGLISHVPGGLGVFEAVILLVCGTGAASGTIAGALVLYRVIYYFAPLGVAMSLLAGFELRSGPIAPAMRAAIRLSPWLLATLTFIVGVMLLLSGVTPGNRGGADFTGLHLPLPLIEATHLIGSIVGLCLLFIARGLLDRLDVAWWAALLLTIVAAAFAWPKGGVRPDLIVPAALAVLLAVSRKEFYRKSSLVSQAFEPGWLAAVGCVLLACVWVLFFAYRDVVYAHELWWQFELDAHAPRSLRGLMAVWIVALGFSLWQLFRTSSGTAPRPTPAQLDDVERIIRTQPVADASLALTGDKSLLFSASRNSFLMFGKQRRSWIALYDPIGLERERQELIWRFVEIAHEHGGRAAFYQVRPEVLPLYLDAGLRAFKLGEEALVPLADFSLQGPRRANLRQGVSRAEREGLTFEVLAGAARDAVIPELRVISDQWLRAQSVREKGFSIGAFHEPYLLRQPVAVVRAQARIVAFANLLCTELRQECSVDLMRHVADPPRGTMDFLFAKTLQHFRDEGYRRFSLGMAPMSGMARHTLAPRWHRLGNLVFEHGERFYNFRGLRSFKEKFDPVWEPRYLAAGGGIGPFLALSDVAALIGGGFRGVVAK